MAGNDSQKHFLSLIRDFASERSQGERRLVCLRKKIEELQSKLEAANAELEIVKRTKETAEQELKGCEVEISLIEASIQTLEARISAVQGEIASIRSDLAALKNKEGASRDQFISQMVELNHKIRKFQNQFSCSVESATEESYEPMDVGDRVTLEEMLANVISQTAKEEEECQAEQNIQSQIHQELIYLEKRMSLMDMMIKGTKELEDLTRYPYQIE